MTCIRNLIAFHLVLLSTCLSETINDNSEWLRGAFRINTDVSAGKNTFADIAQIARDKDLQFIVFTDQYIVRGEYGLPPFRNVLKYVQERRSVVTHGIEEYLRKIEETQQRFPDLLIVPGADVAPIYHWTGSPFKPPLVGYRWSQQITLLGSKDPEFYRNIPAIHNDPIGFRFPESLIKWIPMLFIILGGVLIPRGIHGYKDKQGKTFYVYERGKIILGCSVMLIALLWLLNNRPFHLVRYNQYKDNGLTPFQTLLDYAADNKVLSFWSAPEADMRMEYGPFVFNKYGHVILHTRSYIDDIVDCRRNTGFAGIYADTVTAYQPGKQWDRMLTQYCRGERLARPVVIGEIDYHADRELDLITTVARVKERSEPMLLKALENGNSYAVGGSLRLLFLKEIKLSTDDSSAGLGETLDTTANEVTLSIIGGWRGDSAKRKIPENDLFIIVDGKVVKKLRITEAPFEITEDILLQDEKIGKQYLRFYFKRNGGNLVANPIFIDRTQ